MGVGLTGWRESHDRNFWMVSGLSRRGVKKIRNEPGEIAVTGNSFEANMTVMIYRRC